MHEGNVKKETLVRKEKTEILATHTPKRVSEIDRS